MRHEPVLSDRRPRISWPPARAWCVLISAIVIACGVATPGVAREGDGTGVTTFTLHADVDGLYPDATRTAAVAVDNPFPASLTVLGATVEVGDAGPGCPSANLRATPFSGAVTVAANGRTTLPIRFHMLDTAPDACQGASFQLTLAATGTLAAGTDPDADPRPLPFTGVGRATILVVVLGVAAVAIGAVLSNARRRRAAEER